MRTGQIIPLSLEHHLGCSYIPFKALYFYTICPLLFLTQLPITCPIHYILAIGGFLLFLNYAKLISTSAVFLSGILFQISTWFILSLHLDNYSIITTSERSFLPTLSEQVTGLSVIIILLKFFSFYY